MKQLVFLTVLVGTLFSIAPHVCAEPASSAQAYQIVIESPTTARKQVLRGVVGETPTATAIKPVPGSSVKISFTNLNGLLYQVLMKDTRTALTPPAIDFTKVNNNGSPFTPTQLLHPTNVAPPFKGSDFFSDLSGKAEDLTSFTTLDKSLLQMMVDKDKEYRNDKTAVRYPVILPSETDPVTKLLTAAGFDTPPNGQPLSGVGIEQAGLNYLGTVRASLKTPLGTDVIADLVNKLSALPKPQQPQPQLDYLSELGTEAKFRTELNQASNNAAKIYNDILALKKNGSTRFSVGQCVI